MIELAPSPDAAVTAKQRTILLVEDDPILRRLFGRFLQTLDCELVEAPNGASAVEVAMARDKPIHLIVTDIVMPSMDGFELASRLAPLHPEARVLFMTGYADDSPFVRGGLRRSSYSYMLKPFTQVALLRRITELLAAQPSTQKPSSGPASAA